MLKLAIWIASSVLAILLGLKGSADPLPPPTHPVEIEAVVSLESLPEMSVPSSLSPSSTSVVEVATAELPSVVQMGSVDVVRRYEALPSGAFRIFIPDRKVWGRIFRSAYENGAENEVGYVDEDGCPHGRWTKYDPETGEVCREGWYDHGLKYGLWTFEGDRTKMYENGLVTQQ